MNETENNRSDGTEEYESLTKFLQKNNIVLPLVALIISIGSFLLSLWSASSSAKSAESSAAQLRLASRPSFYGKCTATQNDYLKLSPVPDAFWFAISPNKLLATGEYNHPVPYTPNYKADYPFFVGVCTLTNIGKGAAANINLEVTTLYIRGTSTSDPIKQEMRINYLGTGEKYVIVVANRTAIDASILMPQHASFDIGATGEHIAFDPILHNEFWTQVTVNNRPRPANLPALK